MTVRVLRLKGLPGQTMAEALEDLRARLPGGVFTPKTSDLVEAHVDDNQVPLLESLEDWDVSRPSYAEISPPARDWARLRSKLKG